jgi:hypothetical protein
VLFTAASNDIAKRLFAQAEFRPTMVEMTRELDWPSCSGRSPPRRRRAPISGTCYTPCSARHPQLAPFLVVTPATLRWVPDAPYWLDVAALEDALPVGQVALDDPRRGGAGLDDYERERNEGGEHPYANPPRCGASMARHVGRTTGSVRGERRNPPKTVSVPGGHSERRLSNPAPGERIALSGSFAPAHR